MTNAASEITTLEKLCLIPLVVRTIFTAFVSFLNAPFRGPAGAPTVFKHVVFNSIKTFLNGATFRQLRWLEPSTEDAYQAFAKRKGFPPDSLTLSDGCKAHWIGRRNARKVYIYFHGGGYVNTPSVGHFQYVWAIQKILNQNGHDIAICFLGYTLISKQPWPKQLDQASELLRILIEKYDKKPENIIVGGDSAGGNLAVALLSHILHPHPSGILPVKLSVPLAGAVLLSPWVGFDVTLQSFRSNRGSDMMDGYFLRKTSDYFVGDEGPNEYNEPARAEAEWWKGLDSVVKDILVWGGGGEVLIDSICTFAKNLEIFHSRTEFIISPNSCHEEMITDVNMGYAKSKTAEDVENWLMARL